MTATPHPIALVTGTSSGIGEVLARELLGRGWQVVGMARRDAPITAPGYTHHRIDIGDLPALTRLLDSAVAPRLAAPGVTRVGLVNNAALVALTGTMDRLDATELPGIYAVNTAAPVLLMGWMLRHQPRGVALRMVNVSTGAAVTPLPGMGAYGQTKAALRMAGMIVAAELDARPEGARPDATVFSFEPGLVDTPMQLAARTSTADTLPIVQMFKDWQASGTLVPAEGPAGVIADYLEADGHSRWLERRYDPARERP